MHRQHLRHLRHLRHQVTENRTTEQPNNRTTEQPNRPSPPSPARVEQAYSGRKRPPMHPTRLRCCCSACWRFCALYFTCAAAAAHHQRGPLRHLRAALGAAADAAAPLLHRRAHLGDASAGFMDAMPRGWQPCHFLWPDHSDPAAVVLYCVRCARARGTSIQLRPRMETRLSFACTCTALPCTGRAHDLIAISHRPGQQHPPRSVSPDAYHTTPHTAQLHTSPQPARHSFSPRLQVPRACSQYRSGQLSHPPHNTPPHHPPRRAHRVGHGREA